MVPGSSGWKAQENLRPATLSKCQHFEWRSRTCAFKHSHWGTGSVWWLVVGFGGGTFPSSDCWVWGAYLRLSSLGNIRKRDSERAWGLGSSCALSQFYKVLAFKWLSFSSFNNTRIEGKTGLERGSFVTHLGREHKDRVLWPSPLFSWAVDKVVSRVARRWQ